MTHLVRLCFVCIALLLLAVLILFPHGTSQTVAPFTPNPTALKTATPTASATLAAIGLDTPLARATQPVGMVSDSEGNFFIIERTGVVRVFDGSVWRAAPYLDISDTISLGNEQGLLSFVFDPNYEENGYSYIYYVDANRDSRIVRYTRAAQDPYTSDPNSAFLILWLGNLWDIHYGGQMVFGPDNYLYVGIGDGGVNNWAQNLSSLRGKVLRLDVQSAVAPTPYVIPTSNPLHGWPTMREEIWGWGLRNPWRFSFDRQTGDLYIADVGERVWEEVNFASAASRGGENYGWSLLEGRQCHLQYTTCQPTPGATPAFPMVTPVFQYNHSDGQCAGIGGYVYRGTRYPDLHGTYYVADFCNGRVWGLRQNAPGVWQNAVVLDTPYSVTSFAEDNDGELYLISSGGIQHIYQADMNTFVFVPLVLH